ncbi:mannose-6-phosphate isomerase [Dickeya lacustris]|uniref:mannose-6-phosphate isomerase n=1 Tax=Dickeya lacustris TaxID=2259638 RepID=A0ABY8G878_9GAMM|nr:mannose-6-phosphate isomerase [Dickeya lacustris]WFN56094.1 mannose-6-phosphate isomerase [Dickeya lacustris]
MQKMRNSVQHYAWGSHSALTTLYGIENPDNLPMAELWMGAHPKSSSLLLDEQGCSSNLRDELCQNLPGMLGREIAQRFGELPFLFKVLCAEQPLSIQVHPNKASAQAGFARENAAGIPLDAPERNYKDANHKPELVFALTPYLAMNGFREFDDIAALLHPLRNAHPAIAEFLQNPQRQTLAILFASLLGMAGEQKTQALSQLKQVAQEHQGEPWDTLRFIARYYPDDGGLFSPLLLNVVTLAPGEAMFLRAETPHAYLHGIALEVMANSDNVLRAGLTPKHIDIPELLANVRFEATPVASLLTSPEKRGNEHHFPVPVDDFAFSLHYLNNEPQHFSQQSAAIVFCIEGSVLLKHDKQQLNLLAGESCFIPAYETPIQAQGNGKIARVYNRVS